MIVKAYWFTGTNNFGDLLTKYWIEKLTGVAVEWAPTGKASLFGCGSIVDVIPDGFDGDILGSGIMYGDSPHVWTLQNATIKAVRGPLTAQRLGIEGVPYGDMGVLFALYRKDVEKEYEVGLLAHYIDHEKKGVDSESGIPYHSIDIQSGIENVVREAAKCKRIISSSLHGIILADALGIESKWRECKAVAGNGFKFNDYAASLDETITPGVWRLGNQEKAQALAVTLRAIVRKTVKGYTDLEAPAKETRNGDMMKIKCSNLATRGMTLPGLDNAHVVFSATGLATVPDNVGRFLTAKYSVIEEVKARKPKKEPVDSLVTLPKEGE